MNPETFFLPASCKVTSFPLLLHLMHECYEISFPGVFHFLIWRCSCFVVHFHISSQKRQGNGIGILFFTFRTSKNNEKLKLSSTNKTHVYSLLVTFDVHVCSNRKEVDFCVQFFKFWFMQILKFCKSLFIAVFDIKAWSANVIKLSSNYKKFCRVVFKRLSFIRKSIFKGNININTLVV